FSWGAIALLVLAVSATAQVGDKVFIEGARIVPVVGPEIEKGNILIENGKIVAIGAEIEKPFDARVIDAVGRVAFPGWVDPMNSRGLDVSNENLDVVPFLEVYDAIDPSDRNFELALRHGITTLHVSQGNNTVVSGLSRVLRPVGLSVQEMTVRADGGLKIAFAPKNGYDHAVQRAVLRETFDELDRYLEALAERLYEADLKKKGEDLTVGPEEAREKGKDLITLAKIDDAHRNLMRLRQGRLDAYLYCERAMDIAPALAFAKAQGIDAQSSVVLDAEAHKGAALLKDLARPVILDADRLVYSEVDRITLETEDTFVPSVLVAAKVPFCIGGTLEPWLAAARCVREGVSRQVALEACTLQAAKSIGMGHRVGSLEVGKDGNVLLLTGDPLDTMTWVDEVWIEGRRVYERSKDQRLRDLLLGIEETNILDRRAEEEAKKKAAESEKSKEKAKDADKGAKKPAAESKDDGAKKDQG
ncbi:MAG: amidohydrolase family protein, partial [Planctomycetes bacterium]|nr:amidohydrolase family protein [Planctomycetota bacterium]